MRNADSLAHLSLKTLRLVESKFEVARQIHDEEIDGDSTSIQTRRWVEFDDQLPGLTTFVSLGIRLIKNEEQLSETPNALYTLEAKYALQFEVDDDLDEDREKDLGTRFLPKFFQSAPINIVWPFWREHIFSTLRSASLPTPEVELMPSPFDASVEAEDVAGGGV